MKRCIPRYSLPAEQKRTANDQKKLPFPPNEPIQQKAKIGNKEQGKQQAQI
jgi:hypothetical protein